MRHAFQKMELDGVAVASGWGGGTLVVRTFQHFSLKYRQDFI